MTAPSAIMYQSGTADDSRTSAPYPSAPAGTPAPAAFTAYHAAGIQVSSVNGRPMPSSFAAINSEER